MGLIKSDAPQVLNFIVTGQVRCGASAIQQSVNRHTRAVCHADVMHPDNAIRRAAHEEYFGPSGNTPDWLVDGHISGEQYLTNKSFDKTVLEENVVGGKVLYPHIYNQYVIRAGRRDELMEFLKQRGVDSEIRN